MNEAKTPHRRAWTILKKGGREYSTGIRHTPNMSGQKEIAKSRKVSDWGYVNYNGIDMWGFETKSKAQSAAAKDKERFQNEMNEAKNEIAKDLRTSKYSKRVVKDKTKYDRKSKDVKKIDEVSDKMASRYYKKSVKDLRNRMADRKEKGAVKADTDKVNDDDRKIMNRVFGQRDAKKRMNETKALPPHLAKLFDKNGDPKNPKVKAAWNKRKSSWKDVTPKGYGPDDVKEEDVRTPSLEQIAAKHDVPLGVITKQLNMGIKVEMEHTTSREEAAEIARDHLTERPDYYSKLNKMEKTPVSEDAPVNATGASVPGTGDTGDVWKKGTMLRRKKFAGQECFVVDSATYSQCIQGKKKFAHYKSYVGECETGQAIREYGRQNPGAPIIVMDEKTGAMSYLRYGGKWPK